jgi:hypothetical protein
VASRYENVVGVIPFNEVVNKLIPSNFVDPKTCNLYDGVIPIPKPVAFALNSSINPVPLG